MKQFIFSVCLVFVTASTCFAWDPSGTWAIEGRTDTIMNVFCTGNVCKLKMQTNYGKYDASGFVNGDKLVVAYNYLTETAFGFILFERQNDKSMLQTTLDITGKVVWNGKLLRK